MSELHVVIVGPRSSFDVAVVARTLFAGLGDSGWVVSVVGRVPRSKSIVESRVPVRLAVDRILFLGDTLPGQLKEPVVIVDPARRDGLLPEKPRSIVVCVSGDCGGISGVRHGVLGAGDPVYEAIAMIYAYYIRGSRPPCAYPRSQPTASLVPKALYLARKLLEAVEWFDNRLLLKPSVVAHAVNKAVMDRGLLVDLRGWRLEGELYTRQVVELEVYDWRLRFIGDARVVFDTSNRLVRIEGVPILDGIEVCLDPEHGRACIGPGPGHCIETGREATVEEIGAGFDALGL
ncbi:hypothetical protein Pyrfu_1093 [Pyrolobus fumarii 1A]|uniref:Uncharacterized protein n=1 Tax=Pyrolobus fumarii (strain DSM 11204 / 1A) TaxID=694429 RepID=G0EF64_PYRF1|nr:hypothetical protein [Pyrolobus fumarii]AEM38961.1 hypothetical protein Pyrfu_1093 [Pyrolobus fumarii 1A]